MRHARRRIDLRTAAPMSRAAAAWLIPVVSLCACGTSSPRNTTPPNEVVARTASLSDTSEPATAATATTTATTAGTPRPGSLTERLRQIATEQPGVLRSATSNGQTTTVILRADQQALADELLTLFSAAVQVRLGNFDHPLDPTTATDLCPSTPEWLHNTDELDANLTLATDTVVSGADVTGALTVTNVSTREIVLGGGPYTAVVRNRDTRAVIGIQINETAYAGGEPINLQPGDSHSFDVNGTTASCDPTLGAALPPGDYDVTVDLLSPELSAPTAATQLAAGPALLRIIAP